MNIAFIGNDGSGKTTLSKNLHMYLNELGVKNEYREEFNYFILNYFFKLLGKSIEKVRTNFIKKTAKPKIKWYFKVWPFFVLIDQFLLWSYIKIFKRREIVISDRYVYDFLMSWEWLGYSNKLAKWLYYRFPKPDVIFICDAKAQTSYNRKRKTHSYNLEFYEIQRNRYLNLADELKIKIVNTEKPVKVSFDEVLKEFRKFFISELSDEDKVLTLVSYPRFTRKLGLELEINWSSLNWSYIIDMAFKNNVELLICKNLLGCYREELPIDIKEEISEIVKTCKKQKEKVTKTLEIISEKFKNENVRFLVFKTFPPFDYTPVDIDILVEETNFEKAKKILKDVFSENISQEDHSAATFKKEDLITVDLHYEIFWAGIKPIDEKSIWRRCRKVKINKVDICLPSIQDELYIVAAHSAFQHHYTTLGEFYFITSLSRMLDHYELLNLLKTTYMKFLIPTLILREFFIYGQEMPLTNLGNKNLDFFNINTIIFFHPLKFIPKNTPEQFLDFLLTLYRNLRFRINGELPYNQSWMGEKK